LDKHPISEQEETAIEYTNLVFFVIFFAEMILKLIGMGWKSYMRDRTNIFDMVIVLMSTVDVALFFISFGQQKTEAKQEDN
jgi:hypothetical protein